MSFGCRGLHVLFMITTLILGEYFENANYLQ